MKLLFLGLDRPLAGVILSVVLTSITTACLREKIIYVRMEDKTPPSFTVSGASTVAEFVVEELPRTKLSGNTNVFTVKGGTIWKISPPNSIDAALWPTIKYGDLPDKFLQTVPEHGPPPKLVEGGLYVARFLDGPEAGAAVFFKIREGKAINVSDEVLGP